MKKSLIAPAALFALALVPTTAFANYYGYQRCLNNGGGYIGCLGELADTMVMDPGMKEEFGFLSQHDQGAVLESIRMNEGECGRYGDKDRAQCYLNSLRRDLDRGMQMERARPAIAVPLAPARPAVTAPAFSVDRAVARPLAPAAPAYRIETVPAN